MLLSLLIDLKRFWKIALIFVLFITSLNLSWSYIHYNYDNIMKPFDFLNVNSELNLPTFYSVLIILINSALLYVIARFGVKDNRYWYLLSIIFLYLSFDEMCSNARKTNEIFL